MRWIFAGRWRWDHFTRLEGIWVFKALVFASGILLLTATSDGIAFADSSTKRDCKHHECGVEVDPILTCIVQQDNSHFTAVFGYKSKSRASLNIPIGTSNTFDTLPADRGQPTSFRPGDHPGVFEVTFSTKLVWTLGKEQAIASGRHRGVRWTVR